MKQQTFSSQGVFEKYGWKGCREMFLDEMEHSVCTTAASVADKHMLADLLHGQERKMWGDGGYQGQGETIRNTAPLAQDRTCRRTRYKNYVDELQKARNKTKSRVRAKVEHPFRILKRVFGFDKTRYRGIAKNHNRLCACFALVNLYLPQTAGRADGVVCLEGGKSRQMEQIKTKYK